MFRMADCINPFSIVESYLIAIFCKYLLKDFYNLRTIIRDREYSMIFLTFEGNSMGFEPLSTLSWRKFPEWPFYKITPPSIFREKDFLIIDPCCEITSSSTRNDNFISWSCIFFENLDMKILSLSFQTLWGLFWVSMKFLPIVKMTIL